MAKRKKTGRKGVRKSKKLGKNFWIGLGVVVVVVLLIIVLLFINSEEKAGEEEEKEIVPGSEDYYDALEDDCRQLEQIEVGCCLVSANVMRGGEYSLAEEGECPEGLELEDLGCDGSYEWCK